MEESITSITYSSYKYLHILTIKFLAHIPHFTKMMVQCPQASIFSASQLLTALQLIQYIYILTYNIHLSLSYSTQCYKRPNHTQKYLETLWPIETTKMHTETTLFCCCCKRLISISELSFCSQGFFISWSQWWVKQLHSIFRQSSPLVQHLKEQKICHVKHQHCQHSSIKAGPTVTGMKPCI